MAGALADNLLGFVRLLRRAGVSIGPSEGLLAARALAEIGFAGRDGVRAALRAALLHRHDDLPVFEQAFDLWWRAPEPVPPGAADATAGSPASRRVAEALAALRAPPPPPAGGNAPPRPERALRVSERERLGRLDFESLSAEDLARAREDMRRLSLRLETRPTRRFRPDPSGPRADLRATLRRSLRRGGQITAIECARRIERPPPLVILCDISGSMAGYARVLLHFLHAVASTRNRVHVFLFGTQLTDVSRALRHRDPEVAMEAVGRAVPDWSGGTRIGQALATFNHRWARRVLGGGATVLLITDGLDREGADGLSEATARLRGSSRRLIWLNPLLRWSGFQPRSQGARALLPQVHEHRPVHNLDSLRALVAALSGPAGAAHRSNGER